MLRVKENVLMDLFRLVFQSNLVSVVGRKCQPPSPAGDRSVFSFNADAWYRPLCLQDVSGMSLSMLAAAGGHDDILRLLIRKGVRVNNRQKNGTTALMHAAEKVGTSHPLASSSSHLLAYSCALWIVTLNYPPELPDDGCYPARGRVLRQRSDPNRRDGTDEGNDPAPFI